MRGALVLFALASFTTGALWYWIGASSSSPDPVERRATAVTSAGTAQASLGAGESIEPDARTVVDAVPAFRLVEPVPDGVPVTVVRPDGEPAVDALVHVRRVDAEELYPRPTTVAGALAEAAAICDSIRCDAGGVAPVPVEGRHLLVVDSADFPLREPHPLVPGATDVFFVVRATGALQLGFPKGERRKFDLHLRPSATLWCARPL